MTNISPSASLVDTPTLSCISSDSSSGLTVHPPALKQFLTTRVLFLS